METVDSAVVLMVPGAMAAGLTDALFWGSLVLSLVIAFAVAWPVNRWLIGRGLGHAVVMATTSTTDKASPTAGSMRSCD
jgi:hypothetical protein